MFHVVISEMMTNFSIKKTFIEKVPNLGTDTDMGEYVLGIWISSVISMLFYSYPFVTNFFKSIHDWPQ